MERRAYVCICVKLVKAGNKTSEEIVPFKFRRPELLGSGVNEIYDHRYGIGDDYKIHKLFK